MRPYAKVWRKTIHAEAKGISTRKPQQRGTTMTAPTIEAPAYYGTFEKTPVPDTTRAKVPERNDFAAPTAELADTWDTDKKASTQAYTVTVPKVDQERVRRLIVKAGKACTPARSMRQVWVDAPDPANFLVTFYPVEKIVRARKPAAVVAAK